MAQVNY